MTPIPIVAIVGRSGSGKTTLLEGLIPELKRRGYRVAVIKHIHDAGIQFDLPGKDSWRFARAGADQVVLAAPDTVVHVRHRQGRPTLAEVVRDVCSVDLILVEGYKQADVAKIEVNRHDCQSDLVCGDDKRLIGVASDQRFDVDVPQYDLGDVGGLADLIQQRLLLRDSPPGPGERGEEQGTP